MDRQAWLKYRINGIGASDASIIMGKSQYKSRLELYNDKISGKTEEESKHILFIGHLIESWARPHWELESGLEFRPAFCQHKKYGIFFASLDGWNAATKTAWECKYLSKENFYALRSDIEPINRIPRQYVDQIMHQFFVTGCRAIWFSGIKREKIYGVWEKELYTFEITRTDFIDRYIREILLPEELKFWCSVLKRTPPKKYTLAASETLKKILMMYAILHRENKSLRELAEESVKKIMGENPVKMLSVKQQIKSLMGKTPKPVSYTHLTLPTIYSV